MSKNWNRDIVANLMSMNLNLEAAKSLHETRLAEIKELRKALRDLMSYEEASSDKDRKLIEKAFSIITGKDEPRLSDILGWGVLGDSYTKHSRVSAELEKKISEVEILGRYIYILKKLDKNLPPEVKKP